MNGKNINKRYSVEACNALVDQLLPLVDSNSYIILSLRALEREDAIAGFRHACGGFSVTSTFLTWSRLLIYSVVDFHEG
jgi:hypothetical protein